MLAAVCSLCHDSTPAVAPPLCPQCTLIRPVIHQLAVKEIRYWGFEMGGSVTINKATVKNAEIQKVIIVAKKQLHQHRYFNPPALFLASIKAGNVSYTAEQSQESMFSFFLPFAGVVW